MGYNDVQAETEGLEDDVEVRGGGDGFLRKDKQLTIPAGSSSTIKKTLQR